MTKEAQLELYYEKLDSVKLEETWNILLKSVMKRKGKFPPFFCDENNFGELYELGLEHVNKLEKKELGKYYTPYDVSTVLAQWLVPLKGENIADVCCGTGNLIINYMRVIGKEKAIELLENRKIYLYDIDKIAIKICKYRIALIYGEQYLKSVHTRVGDFLDIKTVLPPNCKVISNPPYFKIKEIQTNWEITKVINNTKELYCAFIEKICKQAESAVIISPYSFISGNKFYSLRQELNKHSGYIISFDNVPGNIFNGRKKGIFNTNSTNAVRAAITVIDNIGNMQGFKISPIIRFKNREREDVLDNNNLLRLLGEKRQIISSKNTSYIKCFKDLEPINDSWNNISKNKLENYLSKDPSKYCLNVPNTCRYFTVASSMTLDRSGKHVLYFNNEKDYTLAYAFINSSFAYWYWRMYDGGINYSKSLLYSLPVYFDKISQVEYDEIQKIAKKMISHEEKYLCSKMNAKKYQFNIKFPIKYRKELDSIFLSVLGFDNEDCFNKIHANNFAEEI